MAVVSFAVMIATAYRGVVASAFVIDGSQQRTSTGTEDATKTNKTARLVAAKCESILGPVGTFDDADDTVGDYDALDIAVRMMPLYVFNTFSLTKKGDGRDSFNGLLAELETLADARRQEASTLVVHDPTE
jgi:hypothetical protein